MSQVIHVEGNDLGCLLSLAESAYERGTYLRVTIEGGAVKVCDGQRMWSSPLGFDQNS